MTDVSMLFCLLLVGVHHDDITQIMYVTKCVKQQKQHLNTSDTQLKQRVCVCVGLLYGGVSEAQVSGGSSGEEKERHPLHLLPPGCQQLPQGKQQTNIWLLVSGLM